jgi:hypothetical protein
MKTYLKMIHASYGSSPTDIIEKMNELGWKPVMGKYDFMIEWTDVKEFYDKIDELHKGLQGLKVQYMLTTEE